MRMCRRPPIGHVAADMERMTRIEAAFSAWERKFLDHLTGLNDDLAAFRARHEAESIALRSRMSGGLACALASGFAWSG